MPGWKFKSKQCMEGECDVCGSPTFDEEPLPGAITLTRWEGNVQAILGEWCSEECLQKEFLKSKRAVEV